mmetsp:Transcript_1542/g.2161  ORF Transcript_1542/g.2161 Transcript_1542/m.2161 type:complete len:81 (+) Transcript_1542:386-628(+)
MVIKKVEREIKIRVVDPRERRILTLAWHAPRPTSLELLSVQGEERARKRMARETEGGENRVRFFLPRRILTSKKEKKTKQ